MSQFESSNRFQSRGSSRATGAGRIDRPATAFDALRMPMPGDERPEPSEPTLPRLSLKKRSAEERSKEIIDHLKDIILNPDRGDGKTGMNYRDWSKTAQKEITKAIREAEMSAAFREFMSANRIGGLCVRVAFLLLAAVCSFAAFWYGVLFIWREYGMFWGFGATLSALGLSIAFTTAGLLYGGEGKDAAKREVMDRYKDTPGPRRF